MKLMKQDKHVEPIRRIAFDLTLTPPERSAAFEYLGQIPRAPSSAEAKAMVISALRSHPAPFGASAARQKLTSQICLSDCTLVIHERLELAGSGLAPLTATSPPDQPARNSGFESEWVARLDWNAWQGWSGIRISRCRPGKATSWVPEFTGSSFLTPSGRWRPRVPPRPATHPRKFARPEDLCRTGYLAGQGSMQPKTASRPTPAQIRPGFQEQ